MKNETLITATFGQKFLSRLLDVVFITLLAILMSVFLNHLYEESSFIRVIINRTRGSFLYPGFNDHFTALMFWSYSIIGFLIYYPILESTGGTWGKRIVGIQTVISRSSKTPNLFITFIMSIIFYLTFYFAFIIIGKLRMFDFFFLFIIFSILPLNSFHHKLSKTIIVKK